MEAVRRSPSLGWGTSGSLRGATTPSPSLRTVATMATIDITADHVVIELTPFEKIAGLVGDQVVPLASIVAVGLEPSSLDAARGWRAPGLGVPGRTKIGTWRRAGRRDLVVARRGEPAVSIEATGQRFARYLVATPDAAAVVDRIRSAQAARGGGAPSAP